MKKQVLTGLLLLAGTASLSADECWKESINCHPEPDLSVLDTPLTIGTKRIIGQRTMVSINDNQTRNQLKINFTGSHPSAYVKLVVTGKWQDTDGLINPPTITNPIMYEGELMVTASGFVLLNQKTEGFNPRRLEVSASSGVVRLKANDVSIGVDNNSFLVGGTLFYEVIGSQVTSVDIAFWKNDVNREKMS